MCDHLSKTTNHFLPLVPRLMHDLISMLTCVYYATQFIWRIFSDNIKLHISLLRNYMQNIIFYKVAESGPFLERDPLLFDSC